MHAFGLSMGLIFPVYANFFVKFKQGMLIYFVLGCLFAGYFVGAFSYFIVKKVALKVLNDVTGELSHTAKGDLRPDYELDSNDAFGELAGVSNRIQASVREILNQIQGYIRSISDGHLNAEVDAEHLNGAYAQIMQNISAGFKRTISFLENIPNPFIILNKQSAVIFQNRKALSFFGAKIGALLLEGSGFDKTGSAILQGNIKAAFATSERFHGNIEWAENDQSVFSFEYTGQPIINQNGCTGIALTFTDRTQINRAMCEMEEARHQANLEHSLLEKRDAYQGHEIEQVADILHRIAQNDLTQRYEAQAGNGDTRELYNLFSRIGENLDQVINNFSGFIEMLEEIANEVSTKSGNFVQQCALMDRDSAEHRRGLSSLMENFQRTVDSATKMQALLKNTNDLTTTYKQQVDDSTREMQVFIEGMDNISNSSNQIKNISKVIDEIAFQTNLLALNAAVEAARAGTHGKGFAVVAEEVRSLSNRTSKAAQEIGSLIENTVERIESNKENSHNIQDLLEEISKSVRQITQTVATVTAESNDQLQIANASNNELQQISQKIQSDQDIINGISSDAQSLANQTGVLKQLVDKVRRNKVITNDPADIHINLN